MKSKDVFQVKSGKEEDYIEKSKVSNKIYNLGQPYRLNNSSNFLNCRLELQISGWIEVLVPNSFFRDYGLSESWCTEIRLVFVTSNEPLNSVKCKCIKLLLGSSMLFRNQSNLTFLG